MDTDDVQGVMNDKRMNENDEYESRECGVEAEGSRLYMHPRIPEALPDRQRIVVLFAYQDMRWAVFADADIHMQAEKERRLYLHHEPCTIQRDRGTRRCS
jgi:hypothetical protein